MKIGLRLRAHFGVPADAVESFSSAITRRRLRRGVFKSVAEREDAISPALTIFCYARAERQPFRSGSPKADTSRAIATTAMFDTSLS